MPSIQEMSGSNCSRNSVWRFQYLFQSSIPPNFTILIVIPIHTAEWTTTEAEIFALGTFLIEDLLKLKDVAEEEGGEEEGENHGMKSKERIQSAQRFFKIFVKIHLDLQMVLTNRSQNLPQNLIPSLDQEFALYHLLQEFLT